MPFSRLALESAQTVGYPSSRMTPDPALLALAARMGADLFRRRLAIEQSFSPIRRFAVSPRTFIAKHLLGAAAIQAAARACGLYHKGYKQFITPRVVDHEVFLPDLPTPLDGVTILHLSDLHADLDPGFIPAVIPLLDGLSYDLAVFTGDFRNHMAGTVAPAIACVTALLHHVRAPAFAVLGNHDTLTMVPPFEAAGLRFLLNEHIVWTRGNASLVLAGVDDARDFDTYDLACAFAGAPTGVPRVLLSHAPALYRLAPAYGVDLMLAGHTHGGQICLPGGRMVLTGERSPRRFLRGAWSYGATQGYTSPGTGASGVPLRFNCPAEITRHILRQGRGHETS